MHGVWRDTQRGGWGTIQAPNSPCRGAARYTELTSPRAFQGQPDARVRTPQTLLGLRLCPLGQEGMGQSDSQGASGHQGLCTATWEVCTPSVLRAQDGRVPGHFLPSPHPRACVPGAQRACGAFSVALEEMSGPTPWCCAQDCKSGTPPRSPHRWKLPTVSLQAGAWV